MSIFNAIALIGGLALFLYGMNLLGEGLSKTSGGKLESMKSLLQIRLRVYFSEPELLPLSSHHLQQQLWLLVLLIPE